MQHNKSPGAPLRREVEQYGRQTRLDILDALGSAMSHWITRTTGIETIGELAEADLDTLQRVSGIGEVRSVEILHAAQELVTRIKQQETDIGPKHDRPDGAVSRLAIVFGAVTLEDKEYTLPTNISADEMRAKIDDALEANDITIDEHTQVALEEPSGGNFGIGGAMVVRDWLHRKQGRGLCFKQSKEIRTDIGLYKLWDDPDIHFEDQEERLEFMGERRREGRPESKSHIPDRYDVERLGEANVGMAFDHRNVRMAQWADVVLLPVVDGTPRSFATRTVERMRDVSDKTTDIVTYEQLKLRESELGLTLGSFAPFSTSAGSAHEEDSVDAKEGISNRKFIVTCPQCDAEVWLDTKMGVSQCVKCQNNGDLVTVSAESAGRVLGFDSVSPGHEADVGDDPNFDIDDEDLETGVVTRHEEGHSSDGETSDTGGGGIGSQRRRTRR